MIKFKADCAGVIYDINYVDKNNPQIVDGGEVFNGRVDYEKTNIFVDESLSEDVKKKVILHELIHAYLAEVDPEQNIEAKVKIFTTIFFDLIRHNTEIMEYIAECRLEQNE